MFILVIVSYIGLVIYEFLPLYKEKKWTEFWANAMLTFISFTVAMMLSFKVELPSPEGPIREFITSIFGK